MNLYPVDGTLCFVNTYTLDSVICPFEQLGPGLKPRLVEVQCYVYVLGRNCASLTHTCTNLEFLVDLDKFFIIFTITFRESVNFNTIVINLL